MTTWQIISLFISGGALTIVSGAVGSGIMLWDEKTRADRKRSEFVKDRTYENKKSVYQDVLQEINHSGVLYTSGKDTDSINEEQGKNRSGILSRFYMFASEDVKQKMHPVLNMLAEGLPQDKLKADSSRNLFMSRVRELNESIRKDLESVS